MMVVFLQAHLLPVWTSILSLSSPRSLGQTSTFLATLLSVAWCRQSLRVWNNSAQSQKFEDFTALLNTLDWLSDWFRATLRHQCLLVQQLSLSLFSRVHFQSSFLTRLSMTFLESFYELDFHIFWQIFHQYIECWECCYSSSSCYYVRFLPH